jgi:hypothetical protein
MTDTTAVTLVWVQGNNWTPGGYYHRRTSVNRTACGIATFGHGSTTTEAEARDDWRQPCRECFGGAV